MLPNFQVTSVLIGFFLRKLEVEDFQSFAESLPWRLPEFDADPQVARLPENAGPEQPRVRFASKDGRLNLDVAPRRVLFRILPGEVTRTEKGANIQALLVGDAYEKAAPAAARIHTTLTEHFGATANRLGAVTDMIAPTPSSASQRLQKIVLADKKLFGDRLQEVGIQAHARVQLAGDINVNRRIVVRSARSGPAPGQPQGGDLILNVNVDINTVAEEPYDIASADLEHFMSAVSEHLQTRIPLFDQKALFE